jgi:hypothetical protein
VSPLRGVSTTLALSLLVVAPAAWSDDQALPTPPVPGKSLPAKAPERAAHQAELESAHRAVAQEWRTALVEIARRRPEWEPENAKWIEDIKEGIAEWTSHIKAGAQEETRGAEYHASLKRRILHPGAPIPRDIPPPSVCRADDRDREVLEAFLKHLVDSWTADDLGPKNRRDVILDAYTPFDNPEWFLGALKKSGLPKAAATELEADVGRRNGAGPARLADLTFASPRIIVKDLGVANSRQDFFGNVPDYDELQKSHPGLAAYAIACLPGYSRDGNTAAVRVLHGPPSDPHGLSSWTGLLVRTKGVWKVTWEEFYLPE